MVDLVLLTDRVSTADTGEGTFSPDVIDQIVPALGLLPHTVTVAPLAPTSLLAGGRRDAIVVDARNDLAGARGLLRVLAAAGTDVPVLVIVTEGGLVAVAADWPVDDIVLATAGPAELDTRLRLAVGRRRGMTADDPTAVEVGELAIDEATYSARIGARPLDLTYKEFELLKFLAQHPDRVFSRAHLVQEVWGYDYFGGTRTVDVHVRRLRAKLGVEHEAMIGTVRNVGYKFVRPATAGLGGRRRDPEFDVADPADVATASVRV